MAEENAIMNAYAEYAEIEETDLDELEAILQNQLEETIADFDLLKEEREKIGNPDNLGETIKGVVWEQFINQVASKAGDDFIKENNGLTLDLRDSAHIQTPDNFAKGKLSEHNHYSIEQLKANYDRFKNKPHKEFRDEYVDPGMDETLPRAGELKNNGVDTVPDIYTGREIPTETKLENGKNNPKAAQREHVKPSAELYKDPSLQMANTNEELAAIINDPENLQGYTTSERNIRKSDSSATDMSGKDRTKHWEKADKRAEEHIKKKQQEGEERLRQEGRKTQREEALRAGSKALRAVIMSLLAEFLKEIISKLVKWFKSSEKKIKTFLESLKEAVISFVGKLRTHLSNSAETMATTIASAIFGPVINTIKKIGILLKKGWQSLKEAIAYIKKPENKGKPIGILIAEISKIVMAGLAATGAIVLGEVIEKALIAIPGAGVFFAFEIPLLGSLANILGIFFGAVVAGITGAIALNLIDKFIANRLRAEADREVIESGNKVIAILEGQKNVAEKKVEEVKTRVASDIIGRHADLAALMAGAEETIAFKDNHVYSNGSNSENEKKLQKINDMLGDNFLN